MVLMQGGGDTVGQGGRGPLVGVVWTGARADDDGGRPRRGTLNNVGIEEELLEVVRC